MAIKRISDIRIFKSSSPNIDGQPHPLPLDNRSLTLYLQRVAMKLRELGFSLGDFDHLYLNLTSCLPDGAVQVSARSTCRETAWYRYVDIGTSLTAQPIDKTDLIPLLESALLLFSAAETIPLMRTAFAEANKGEDMLMRYKEKSTAKYTARLFLRLLDNGMYHPLLQVFHDDHILLQRNLSPCWELHNLGSIIITGKAITIKPRQNAFASNLSPIVFHFGDCSPVIPSSS